MIPLYAVRSSNIKALGHDAASNTLAVQFKDGGTYHYAGVSPAQYQALSTAPSIGSHFAQHIRAKFQGQKTPAHR